MRGFLKKLTVRSDVYERAMRAGTHFKTGDLRYVSNGYNRAAGEITAVCLDTQSTVPYVLIKRNPKRPRRMYDCDFR